MSMEPVSPRSLGGSVGDLWGQWACSTGVEHSVGAYCVCLPASLTASLMCGGPRCRPMF